jgi:signal transduction histidine kinase
MSEIPVDQRCSEILALSVHEFRNAVAPLSGYIRMLLKAQLGPLGEQQRHFLELSAKASARLAGLIEEVGELSKMEKGTATINPRATDLHHVLRAAVERMPPLLDRDVSIDLQLGSDPVSISADAPKLTDALQWILVVLRREHITSDRLIVQERAITVDGAAACELRIGDEKTIASFDAVGFDDGTAFNEWGGGCGMTPPMARRILDAHGGRIWGAPGRYKAGARIVLFCSPPAL